jgi:hypothetical protein
MLAWDRGRDALGRPGPLRTARLAVAQAVEDEIRRQLGPTFSLAQLADVYEDSDDWFLPLAARVAPRTPDAWDRASALDGAFAQHRRQATDWSGGR